MELSILNQDHNTDHTTDHIKAVKNVLNNIYDPANGKPLSHSENCKIFIKNSRTVIILECQENFLVHFKGVKESVENMLIRNGIQASVLLSSIVQKEEKFSNTQKRPLKQIKKIIAIASGKGGVGKSTVAVQLAVALSSSGFSTGLLDADIYGPSIPKMLGLTKRDIIQHGKAIIPPTRLGIHTISIGLFVNSDEPLIWRGPIVQKAVSQLFFDVTWPDLDFLIVDLPPGTGDIHLTVVQKLPVTGAVIVSTPQDIAIIDARKAIMMFSKLGIKILGCIENMSNFHCSHCGKSTSIFSTGGVMKEAKERNIPYLGEIPVSTSLRKSCDDGTPLSSELTQKMIEIAFSIIKNLPTEKEFDSVS